MRISVSVKEVKYWSLATIWEKSIKIGGKIAARSRYITFQVAEFGVPHDPSLRILGLVDQLRSPVTA